MTNLSDTLGQFGFRLRMAVVPAIWLVFGAGSVQADTGSVSPTVQQDFQFHCAACHGANGKGDGPVARVLKITPPDLTRITERNGGAFPQAAVFETIIGRDMPISHGTREMPVWGDLFLGEVLNESVTVEEAQEATAEVTERIGRLVKYLETIQTMK
jgi:mono/diheme cytochrome c family protein